MADVFISYKKEERERAHSIATSLHPLLVSTWLDAQLAPGQSFTKEIQKELDQCKAQLVCWSKAATNSEWVRGEAEIGRRRGVLVPVFIEACELLPPFNMLHAEELSDWDGQPDHPGWQGVLRKLGVLLARPGLADLGRLIHSTDAVAWRAWLLRYPGDPGEGIARHHLGDNIEMEAPAPPKAAESVVTTPRVRSTTELNSELEVADFRLRVFRDAAKRFGWKDTKEEQRLELEVAALREAIDRLRLGLSGGRASAPKAPMSLLLKIRNFLKRRSPTERVGIAAAAVLASFAAGFVALALLSIPIQMAQSNQRPQTTDPAAQEIGTVSDANTPVPFDMELLGPSSDTSAYSGEFEAVGFEPTWALQFSDEHATLEFRDGASHNSYGAQREIRSRGAQTIYALGEPLAIVIVRHPCVLPQGVATEFEVHVRSSLTSYRGCAARRQSEHWPPWSNYGSAFWKFQSRPFED